MLDATTDSFETGIYLLTPTHMGTGQAAGAVDLPIAREHHTDHPYLPATALKGVARDVVGEADPDTERLFGRRPPKKGQPIEPLIAGEVVITDGRLLAFPVRSLSAAFYWVTCPLIIQRWKRARGAWGLRTPPGGAGGGAAPSATFQPPEPLVLEDHLVTQVRALDPALIGVAQMWAGLLPLEEELRAQLQARLISLPDPDFAHLVRRTTPVNARVQLTSAKTTDKFEGETGNLWYEETLPSDCLFSAMLIPRKRGSSAAKDFAAHLKGGALLQVGGNETVGQGFCRWTLEPPERASLPKDEAKGDQRGQ